MPRFFITKDSDDAGILRITGDDARHVSRSLRMAVGDKITLCDKEGMEYDCTLTRIRDEECLCEVGSVKQSLAESPARVTVFMAYPKSDKLETIIQKAVELGAYEIIPFESSRCIKRPAKDKEAAKLVRLNKIAEEAAKQSGRAICPMVLPTLCFAEVMKRAADFELPIFCYEGEGAESLKRILQSVNAKKICAVIGCEGGFSPEEAEAARAAGFRMANLGPRILRCETAPNYVLSAISYHFEL
jgi:16S rRNA (uracil1498-N3)-methyltransferase